MMEMMSYWSRTVLSKGAPSRWFARAAMTVWNWASVRLAFRVLMNDHRLKPVVSIRSETLRYYRLKAVVSSRMKRAQTTREPFLTGIVWGSMEMRYLGLLGLFLPRMTPMQ